MTELHELTVVQAASLVRSGELSPVELMESLLRRAGRLEPKLHVWAMLDENAALTAADESHRAVQQGEPLGPLHGVPVGVKDIFYTEGVRTAAGSPIYADFVPSYDATTVARLKRAGAIVMGKTVTTEFAATDPAPTRNPWDPAHTPGGSSTGSAVGVAARIFPAALGSQTAGSVLRPACYNGVVGLKPTFGRISTYGVMALAPSLDTVGMMARTVEDAALILQVVAGEDANDPTSAAEPLDDYLGASKTGRPPRIGIASQTFRQRAGPEVWRHVEDVAERLAAAGAQVGEARVSAGLEPLLDAHLAIMSVEAASVHETDFREHRSDYGPRIRGLIETGLGTSADAYSRAMRTRQEFKREVETVLGEFDVLLSPTAAAPAPRDLNTTGDPSFQIPWTSSGLPTLNLPTGTSESGLPLGTQLASGPFQEGRLLASARWCESVLGVSLTPLERD
jgi:aspartyl-tRNA(Asn)/glutamyl-tRNA(Gln) amidotransferase subunit A